MKVFHNQADSTHFAYSFQKSTEHVGNIFGAWEVLMAHFLQKLLRWIISVEICSIKNVTVADFKLPLLLVLLLPLATSHSCIFALMNVEWFSGTFLHVFHSIKLSLKFRCFFNQTSSWTKPHFILINTKMNITMYLVTCTGEVNWSDCERGSLFLNISQNINPLKTPSHT